MALKTAFFAAALTLVPALASAACQYGMQSASASCVDGQVWDEDTRTCVEPVTG